MNSKTTYPSGTLSTPSITAGTSHPSSPSQHVSTGASKNLVYQLQFSTPREYILSRMYQVSDTQDLCYKSILRIGNLNSLERYIHPIRPHGSTLLHWVAKLGHAELMGKLLRLPAIAVNPPILREDFKEWTTVHYAALEGHAECVRLLLQTPTIDANAKDYQDSTPLLYTAIRGQTECIKLLISRHDILVNAFNKSGWTGLHYATERGHYECIQVLLTHKDIDVNSHPAGKRSPLDLAAIFNYSKCMAVLVSAPQISVNFQTHSGHTPLHTAAFLVLLNVQNFYCNTRRLRLTSRIELITPR